MHQIFLNYRRDITSGWAGRLSDVLEKNFGKENVFRDIDKMPPGIDFPAYIESTIANCSVVLGVIAPGWPDAMDRHGHRRLDDPKDWVRFEISQALAKERLLIPVLVGGAQMPSAEQLPDDIRDFAFKHAYEIGERRWSEDVNRLVSHLEQLDRSPNPFRVVWDTFISRLGGFKPPASVFPRPPADTRRSQPAPAAKHKMGRTFRDVNEPWCPRMVVIPAGRFNMGTAAGEPGREECEVPVHAVRIAHTFALGQCQVTRGEFAKFVKESEHFLGGGITRWRDSGWWLDARADWRSPGFKRDQDDRHPVVGVSWEDAQAYCDWLSKRTGHDYRLPTEAEWEYAARAGTTGPFWMGGTITTDLANFDGRFVYPGGKKGRYIEATVAADDHAPPNRFNLRHMHGNVWEWCEDNWHGSYEGAPSDGSAWTADPTDEGRIARGGSWFSHPNYLRSGSRRHFEPANRYDIVGFRVAKSLVP